ncbi:MAG: sialate O-acetylesterase [Armatimonadota bacterium]
MKTQTTKSNSVPDPDVDLWVCAGQSNMAGAGLLPARQRTDPGITMYMDDGVWLTAQEPVSRIFRHPPKAFSNFMIPVWGQKAWDDNMAMEKKRVFGGVGPSLAFARHVRRHTGRRIGLIPCALGATGMSHWSPDLLKDGKDSLYGNMIARIREVGGNIKGLLWYQGEGETNPGLQDSFEKTWLDFVDAVRRDTGIADLPVLYVQISRYCLDTDPDYALKWEQIRDRQRTAAGKRPNLQVVPAIDLPLDDLIHIGTEGHQRLGKRLAEVALGTVYRLPGHASPIDFESAEVLPSMDYLHNTMRVRFRGVSGRLQSAGRASGFSLRSAEPRKDGPTVFKVEFDPKDPAAAILWVSKTIEKPISLYYGAGLDPYCNIVDSKDMAVPAFGPIPIRPRK